MVTPSKKNCRATVPKIRQKLNLLDINCRTIERCLTKAGLHGRRQVKKPFTSKKLVFCDSTLQESTLHEHLKNGKEYSDESKFNLDSDDGKGYKKKYVRRYNKRYTTASVKFGSDNIVVWGCFSWHGLGPLHRITY
jgi:hypothetical protein